MKLLPFLDQLAAAPTTPAARRDLLKQAGQAAAATLPLALGAIAPAAARPKGTAYDAVLQLLQLERTQVALYTQALAVSGLIPTAQVADFQRMRTHQVQHEAFLVDSLRTAGAVVPPTPLFDFSGRHNNTTNPVLFPNVLSNYDDFLALAQQLEDVGARTYLTYALAVGDDPTLTRALLRTLPVESQHAAHVRALRRNRGVAVKTWPSADDAPIVRPAAAQALATAATGGEDNLTQAQSAGVSVPFASIYTVVRDAFVPDAALAEAFDEPVKDDGATTAAVLIQRALDLFV